jgi:hypothetical protein
LNEPASQPDKGKPEKAGDRFGIFEAVALERLRNGSDTTKAIGFLPLPARLTAIAAGVIAGGGLLWACLARVPVQVDGLGLLIPEGTINTLTAPASGVLLYQVPGVGNQQLPNWEIQRNKKISSYLANKSAQASYLPSARDLEELAGLALRQGQGENFQLPEDILKTTNTANSNKELSKAYQNLFYPPYTVLATIRDDVARTQLFGSLRSDLPQSKLQSNQQRDRQLRIVQYSGYTNLVKIQQEKLVQDLKNREVLYQRYRDLWKKGFISTAQLLEEQNQISAMKGQILNNRREQLTNRNAQVDENLQANMAGFQSTDLRNRLDQQLISYITRTNIASPPQGIFVINYIFYNASIVRAGDEIFSYTLTPPQLPKVIPVFLDQRSGQQVSQGMKVLVTPKGISRAQYGGIPGTITAIYPLPTSADSLVGIVGTRAMATQVAQQLPNPIVAYVRLDQAGKFECSQVLSSNCYTFSSRRSPPHAVRLGTSADVQITTKYSRPIEFVMPAVRKALGLVVENS